MRLDWLPRAHIERAAQLDYIATDNPLAAADQDDEIQQQSLHLADHPNIGRTGRLPGTRELVIQRTPFILVYRVRTKERRIEVLRILHGAQQWPPT